jgi:hypothetical protein
MLYHLSEKLMQMKKTLSIESQGLFGGLFNIFDKNAFD